MTDYKVFWEIDVSASSPREAAEKAWEIMRAPFSSANAFTVSDGVDTIPVDLEEAESDVAPVIVSDGVLAAPVEIQMLEDQIAAPTSNVSDKDVLPTVVIAMDCGAIHGVRSSVSMRIVMLDVDTEGADKEDLTVINGDEVYLHDYNLNSDAEQGCNGIDHAFVTNVLMQVQKKVEQVSTTLMDTLPTPPCVVPGKDDHCS